MILVYIFQINAQKSGEINHKKKKNSDNQLGPHPIFKNPNPPHLKPIIITPLKHMTLIYIYYKHFLRLYSTSFFFFFFFLFQRGAKPHRYHPPGNALYMSYIYVCTTCTWRAHAFLPKPLTVTLGLFSSTLLAIARFYPMPGWLLAAPLLWGVARTLLYSIYIYI